MLTRGNFRHSTDDIIPHFRKVTDAVHAHGTVILHQLYHVGQHGDFDNSFAPNWSPSGLPSFHDSDGSHRMSEAEIEELIDAFVAAARRARQSGFDGIELFAAYHALIDQFWTPWSNRRDDRWGRCDVKTTALAASVLGGLAAHDEGADEVVWVSADGELLEGGHTSLFVRDLAGWHTAPLSASILPGVTRALLLGLGRADGIAIEERAPRLAERAHWREAFLCGTTTGVRGLAALDGAPIGDGRPGAETIHFARLLDAAERREAAR